MVLDLRTDVEVELEGPGPMTAERTVRIEHRSLYPDSGGNTDLETDTVKPWGPSDEGQLPEELPVVRAYMSYLGRRPDSVVGSVRAIARANGAVLVHCAAGKDRTGVGVALALEGHDPQRHAPGPGTIERVLKLVDDRIGGSAAWLSAHGLDDSDIERLRRRLAPAGAGSPRAQG